MNGLQIFKYNSAEVRTVIKGGEPWWVLKDVCAVLGLSDTNKVADRLDDDELTRIKFVSGGQNREMYAVNESGLYNVILRSDKPEAKAFKRWVTHEVLPSIRKHGAYMTPEILHKATSDPDFMIGILTALKGEQEKNAALAAESDKQKQIIGELKPKADYVDYILSSIGTMTITQIAADYSMSAKKLNKILKEERIQRYVGDQWVLYREHMSMGYTKSETIPIIRSDGRPDTRMFTKWTQKGRLMINEILNQRGIYANMDIVRPAS